MSDITYSWNEYIRLNEELVYKVAKSGWQFDDMVDSGKTIQEVVAHLKKRYPAITEIRVAVLWWKAPSVLKPDWHCVYFEDSPWIHQPFECYDDLGAEAFIEAIESGKTLGRLQ